MPGQTPQVLSLLDRVLNQSPTERRSGFGFNTFGKNKPPKEEPSSYSETPQQILVGGAREFISE
jgi:hypothetical protein